MHFADIRKGGRLPPSLAQNSQPCQKIAIGIYANAIPIWRLFPKKQGEHHDGLWVWRGKHSRAAYLVSIVLEGGLEDISISKSAYVSQSPVERSRL